MQSFKSAKFVILTFMALTAVVPIAPATTLVTGGNNSWNNAGNWDAGIPGVGTDATISAGLAGGADSVVPAWSGALILENGSSLRVFAGNNVPGGTGALLNATSIVMNNATIFDVFGNQGSQVSINADITLNGGGAFSSTGGGTAGWNQGRIFNGAISGDGGFGVYGRNHMGYTFNQTNPFSGGLVLAGDNRYGVQFNAPGSAGLGNVTAFTDAASGPAIRLGANDVFSQSAVLTLNSPGWNNSTGGFGPFAGVFNGSSVRIDMQNFNATVQNLVIDGVYMLPGDYTGTDGDWIRGTGILTVLVPEPSKALLLIIGGLAFLGRRSRR